MGNLKGNQNAKKELTKDCWLHLRLREDQLKLIEAASAKAGLKHPSKWAREALVEAAKSEII